MVRRRANRIDRDIDLQERRKSRYSKKDTKVFREVKEISRDEMSRMAKLSLGIQLRACKNAKKGEKRICRAYGKKSEMRKHVKENLT